MLRYISLYPDDVRVSYCRDKHGEMGRRMIKTVRVRTTFPWRVSGNVKYAPALWIERKHTDDWRVYTRDGRKSPFARITRSYRKRLALNGVIRSLSWNACPTDSPVIRRTFRGTVSDYRLPDYRVPPKARSRGTEFFDELQIEDSTNRTILWRTIIGFLNTNLRNNWPLATRVYRFRYLTEPGRLNRTVDRFRLWRYGCWAGERRVPSAKLARPNNTNRPWPSNLR